MLLLREPIVSPHFCASADLNGSGFSGDHVGPLTDSQDRCVRQLPMDYIGGMRTQTRRSTSVADILTPNATVS
jgi:hypothetical protein